MCLLDKLKMCSVNNNQLEELLEKLHPSEIIITEDNAVTKSDRQYKLFKSVLNDYQLSYIPNDWLIKLVTSTKYQ